MALVSAHPKIEAYGVTTDGQRAEAWAATHIKVTIELAVGAQTADMMASQFKLIGAEDVCVAEVTAPMALPGRSYSRNRRMQRISGLLSDETADALVTLRFSIDPDEQEMLDKAWKLAVAAQDAAVTPTRQAACQGPGCDIEFSPKSGTAAKYCSQRCFRAARRAKAAAAKARLSASG